MVDVIPMQVLVIVLSQKFGGPGFWKIGGPNFLEDWSIPIIFLKKSVSLGKNGPTCSRGNMLFLALYYYSLASIIVGLYRVYYWYSGASG